VRRFGYPALPASWGRTFYIKGGRGWKKKKVFEELANKKKGGKKSSSEKGSSPAKCSIEGKVGTRKRGVNKVELETAPIGQETVSC